MTKDNLKTAVQVKKYTGRVGVAAVQEVYAAKTYYNAAYAIVVTNSYFTKQARELAAKLYVTLVDRDKLIALQSSAVKQETINDKIVEKQEKKSKIKTPVLFPFSSIFSGCVLLHPIADIVNTPDNANPNNFFNFILFSPLNFYIV